jgi:hypothetical protein
MEPNTSFSNSPSIFNENDYACWNFHVKAYLKGLNDNVWLKVEKGFERLDGDFDKWSKEDTLKSNWNNCGLSCIFNCVSLDEFRWITLHETTKRHRIFLRRPMKDQKE